MARALPFNPYLQRAQRRKLGYAFLHGQVQRGPGSAQVAHDQVGQHHHQDVATRAFLCPHLYRADLQVSRLAGAEGPFYFGQLFVAIVNRVRVGYCGRKVALEDIAAI